MKRRTVKQLLQTTNAISTSALAISGFPINLAETAHVEQILRACDQLACLFESRLKIQKELNRESRS